MARDIANGTGHQPERGPGRWLSNCLAGFAGYDLALLAQCDEVDRRRAATLAAAIFSGALIHGVSMALTASAFTPEPWIPVAAACVTAFAFLVFDRATIMGVALERGLRMLRRADAAARDHAGGPVSGLVRHGVRVGASAIVSGGLLAGGVTLHIFADDIRAATAIEQQQKDAPLRSEAEAVFEAERALLKARLAEAREREAAAVAEISAGSMSRADERQRLSGAVDAAAARAEDARRRIDEARAEYRRTEKLLWCEETGTTAEQDPGCEGATGIEGIGDRYEAYRALLRNLAAVAEGARRDFAAAKSDLAAAEENLVRHDGVPTPEDAPALERAGETVAALSAQLRRFEETRPERVASLIAAAPDREVLDPDSLYQKIHALWVLSTQSWGFFLALLGIKAAVVTLELIAVCTAFAMPAGAYELALAERHRARLDAARRRYREDVLGSAESDRAWRREIRSRELATELDATLARGLSGLAPGPDAADAKADRTAARA